MLLHYLLKGIVDIIFECNTVFQIYYTLFFFVFEMHTCFNQGTNIFSDFFKLHTISGLLFILFLPCAWSESSFLKLAHMLMFHMHRNIYLFFGKQQADGWFWFAFNSLEVLKIADNGICKHVSCLQTGGNSALAEGCCCCGLWADAQKGSFCLT